MSHGAGLLSELPVLRPHGFVTAGLQHAGIPRLINLPNPPTEFAEDVRDRRIWSASRIEPRHIEHRSQSARRSAAFGVLRPWQFHSEYEVPDAPDPRQPIATPTVRQVGNLSRSLRQ